MTAGKYKTKSKTNIPKNLNNIFYSSNFYILFHLHSFETILTNTPSPKDRVIE